MTTNDNMYYMEGLVYANNVCHIDLANYSNLAEKYAITGKSPEQIDKMNLPSYLRGIYDAAGCCLKSNELTISFPREVESALKQFYCNITYEYDKLLIKNEDAINLMSFIYDKLDYINSYYNESKLVELCKSSDKFFNKFLENVKNYIETLYYAMMPESISYNPGCLALLKGLESCKNTYMKLVKMGVDQEDARYILPMSTQTRVVMTMNVRAFTTFSPSLLHKGTK